MTQGYQYEKCEVCEKRFPAAYLRGTHEPICRALRENRRAVPHSPPKKQRSWNELPQGRGRGLP